MRHDTFLGRLGAIGTLSLGYQVLYVAGIIIVATLFARENTGDPEKQPWGLVLADGMPLLTRTNPRGSDRIFRSLDGQPKTVQERQTFAMGAQLFTRGDLVDTQSGKWSKVRLSDSGNFTEPWFFLQEQVGDVFTGYFVAYSNATRMPLLYLGANGQSTSVPSPEQRFQLLRGKWNASTEEGAELSTYIDYNQAITTSGRILVFTTTGLECVDLKTRTVSNVVSFSDLSSLAAPRQGEFAFGYLSPKPLSVDDRTLLRGGDSIFEIKQGKVATSYIIPETLRKQYFTAYLVDDGTMYYATTSGKVYLAPSHYGSPPSPDNLLKCDKAGRVLQQWAIKQPLQEISLPTNLDFLCITALFPTPLTIVGTLAANNPHSGIDRAELVRRVWPSYLVMFCCGILSVIGAWKLAPRFSGAPVEWGWMVYVFLFGLPGLVGYLMHFRRRRRPLLAPAPQLGTEVFA
ncbi:MAG: hypothetical protein V4719_28210 [Planctomycetota bacterium]